MNKREIIHIEIERNGKIVARLDEYNYEFKGSKTTTTTTTIKNDSLTSTIENKKLG